MKKPIEKYIVIRTSPSDEYQARLRFESGNPIIDIHVWKYEGEESFKTVMHCVLKWQGFRVVSLKGTCKARAVHEILMALKKELKQLVPTDGVRTIDLN